MLSLSHRYMLSDTSAADDFWNHCDKRKNCSWWAISPFSTMISTIITIQTIIYRDFLQYMFLTNWNLYHARDDCRRYSCSVLLWEKEEMITVYDFPMVELSSAQYVSYDPTFSCYYLICSYFSLTLSHIYTLSDASAADVFWYHCGKKRRICSTLSVNFYQLLSQIKLSFIENFYIFDLMNSKVVCCRYVVCGKELNMRLCT